MINCRADVKIRLPAVTTRIMYLVQNPNRLPNNLKSAKFNAARTEVCNCHYRNVLKNKRNRMAFTTLYRPTNG
jgi:hypothetical protein